MSSERYRLSFTTGGLFIRESTVLAEQYVALKSWPAARAQVRSRNSLQVRTATAALRITREVVTRLEHLSLPEIEFLLVASHRERGLLLWSAVCRRYVFVREFATEVLREHFLRRRLQLPLTEFNAFFQRKAATHEEVENIEPSTQAKLRQNLYRMMREADLISEQYLIQPAILTPRFAQLLAQQGRKDLHVYPVTDSDIDRILK